MKSELTIVILCLSALLLICTLYSTRSSNESYACSPAGPWCNSCVADSNNPGKYKCLNDSNQWNSNQALPSSPCTGQDVVKNCNGVLFCTTNTSMCRS